VHDRFMLPYFIEQDLREVLAQLQDSGFAFEPEWFASHMEFRFPKIGSVSAHGVELELRRALEPWNVLAEETSSGRTVRTSTRPSSAFRSKSQARAQIPGMWWRATAGAYPCSPLLNRELRWQR